MRATLFLLAMLCVFVGPVRAQTPLEVGTPESAFAGGPIHLSKSALGMLRAHYQGDKVPRVPLPFRAKLDTALLGRDWPRVEVLKKELTAAQGIVAALAWEQSRFVATGAIGLAEMHALDVAATGSTGLSETAVMLWFYAVAVTMTDGHKCVDDAAKDAHLDRLRGPAFETVTRIVRTISDDRLAAMRDLAIRLETVLAPDRTDDTMCRVGNGKADIKPDAVWRRDASLTRGMLPRHLVALASVMRPRPIARPEPPKPELAKPVGAKPAVTAPEPARVEPAKVEPTIAPPATTEPPKAEPGPTQREAPPPTLAQPESAKAEPPKPEAGPARPGASAPEASKPVTINAEPPKPESESAAFVNQRVGKPDPSRFEPPSLELAAPDPQAKH